jgi:hypothetical protein
MGSVGTERRWAAVGRWTMARQGLRVVLGVLAVGWIAFTVGWIRIGHPLNAVVTALIAAADLIWVVRTGHPAAGAEADVEWSRRAVPVGGAVLVLSMAALSPSRSSTPAGAVIGLSIVLWGCLVVAVWLTGTPARAAARAHHPHARGPRTRRGRPRTT